MNKEELHTIEKTILLDSDNPLKNIGNPQKGIPIKNELEWYVYGCSHGLTIISSAIEKAKISILMFENSRDLIPPNTTYTESEYLEYSIENYFIRSSSLYDRCLLFTCKLLNLGISDENINHVLIVTNEHVKENNLSNPLKKIGKICREYSAERNKIIHHGSYKDESFLIVSAINKTNQLLVTNGEKPKFEKEVIDQLTNDAIKEKLVDLNTHLQKVEDAINEFYTLAEPVYIKMKKHF